MQTISSINAAYAESRHCESASEKELLTSASSSTKLSKLEQVKQRVRSKLQCAESRLAENFSLSTCTGSLSSSSISRFEALRRRIKRKECEAVGELHVPE